jgi:chorismate mutase/prephenate dehydrogenase
MNLTDLRDKLDAIDRELLRLVAERQGVVRLIGELKDRSGSPLRSFSQEREVLDRARQEAARLGLSEDLAADLLARLIEESLTLQERRRVELRGGGDGRSALVIGGSGRMGAWMARFLASQDFAVEVADPVSPRDDLPHLPRWQESDLDHDLIVVAATLRASQEILDELASRRPGGVVFDLGSLKTPLRDSLERLAEAGVRVTSIHPMFGPDTQLLSGRHVILVDLGCEAANAAVRGLFAPTMAEMVTMPLEDHDRLIAYVLGLSHALNVAFVTALAESGEAVPHLARLSSTTFDRQLGVCAAVAQDNPKLYFEIQHLNAFGGESLRRLQEATDRIGRIVSEGDEEAFVGLMEQGRLYLSRREGGRPAPLMR